MINKKLTPKLDIDLHIRNNTWKKYLSLVKKANIKKIVSFTLEQLKLYSYATTVELSIILTDDQEIQKYNLKYRNKNKPTNVLSFPVEQLDIKKSHVLLGDIIFAIETITKEANKQSKNFEDHFIHLLVHGVLHLLGFDHISKDERVVMEKLEVEILKIFNILSPYE